MTDVRLSRAWSVGSCAVALALAFSPTLARAANLMDKAKESKRTGLPLFVMISTGSG
jgi:hypothetical protein